MSHPTVAVPKSTWRLLVLAALRAGPVFVMAVWALRDQAARSVVAVLLAGFLEGYLIAGLTRTWRSFFLAGFPLFALGVLYAVYTVFYGTPPGRSLAFILLSTSPEELLGFFSLSWARIPALGLVVVAGLYLYLAWRLPPTLCIAASAGAPRRRAALALLLPVTIYTAWNPAELIDGAAYNPTLGSVLFFAGTMPNANAILHGSQVAKVPYGAHRVGGEEVHVLILGESARRDSWSVYGYGRPTTPYLSRLEGEAVFLTNAVADANLTSWAVPILLTGMRADEYSAGRIRGNILDLAKEAGYDTSWLLNQDITIALGAGVAADRTIYPPDFEANVLDRHTLDETLLPGYLRELKRAGHARFIGIHMMGSHWEYYRRYPPGFARFGSSAGLTTISIFAGGRETAARVADTYDNTVLYTDWLLQQIIEPVRQLTVPATVTFFPDHGEDLELHDGASGHGGPTYTPHAFAIPAFVWCNEAYRQAYPEKVAALRKNATREIRTHDVFGTIADLMEIQWPGRKPERSFASDAFVPDTNARVAAGGVLISRH